LHTFEKINRKEEFADVKDFGNHLVVAGGTARVGRGRLIGTVIGVKMITAIKKLGGIL